MSSRQEHEASRRFAPQKKRRGGAAFTKRIQTYPQIELVETVRRDQNSSLHGSVMLTISRSGYPAEGHSFKKVKWLRQLSFEHVGEADCRVSAAMEAKVQGFVILPKS